MPLIVKDGPCHTISLTICGNAGVIRITFEPSVLTNGIVASPQETRYLIKRLLAAVAQAEKHENDAKRAIATDQRAARRRRRPAPGGSGSATGTHE